MTLVLGNTSLKLSYLIQNYDFENYKNYNFYNYKNLYKILKISPEKSVCRSEAAVRTGYGTTDGFKLGKEYVKAAYYHPVYLTYIQST